MDDSLHDYALDIVDRTRKLGATGAGREPARHADAATRGAGARLSGRPGLLHPDDFKQLAVPVFAHRVVVNSRHAAAEKIGQTTESVLREIVESAPVPL